MTAPTSPKPTTPADPNDLCTALTKLAEKWDGESRYRWCADRLRALLAAHPAPETVSDTRREDVDALALAINPAAFGGRYSSDFDREEARQAARRVLAVLPAPLVVEEAEIAARALDEAADAQDIDPEFRDPLRLKSDWLRDRAARLRGADRG